MVWWCSGVALLHSAKPELRFAVLVQILLRRFTILKISDTGKFDHLHQFIFVWETSSSKWDQILLPWKKLGSEGFEIGIFWGFFFWKKLMKDYLRDLVPFVKFKKTWKHPWRSANFSKPAGLKVTLLHGCFSHFLNYTNGTKSRNKSI